MSSDPLNTLTDLPMASQKLATQLLGPALSGIVLHLLLFGLMQSQFFAYTSTELYSTDPLRTKLFLWAVVALDFAATSLDAEAMFHYGTDQHRDYASVYVTRPIDSVSPLLTAVIALLVQIFLLNRASALFNRHQLGRLVFIVVISLFAIVSFLAACGSFTIGIMWGYGLVEKALPFTYNNMTSTWLMTSLAVDCALCFTLVTLLRRRFDTASKDSPVRRLIGTTLQSLALTAVFGLAGGIVSCLPQTSDATANVPLFWITPLPSLYALALVTTLASRKERAPAIVVGTLSHMGDLIVPAVSRLSQVSYTRRPSAVSFAGTEKSLGLGLRPVRSRSASPSRSEEEGEKEQDEEQGLGMGVGEEEGRAFSGLQPTRSRASGMFLAVAATTTRESTLTFASEGRQQI